MAIPFCLLLHLESVCCAVSKSRNSHRDSTTCATRILRFHADSSSPAGESAPQLGNEFLAQASSENPQIGEPRRSIDASCLASASEMEGGLQLIPVEPARIPGWRQRTQWDYERGLAVRFGDGRTGDPEGAGSPAAKGFSASRTACSKSFALFRPVQ